MQITVDDSSENKLEDIEKQLISYALNKFQGGREKASKWIGITPRTLRAKIRKYPELGFKVNTPKHNQEYLDRLIGLIPRELKYTYDAYIQDKKGGNAYKYASDKTVILCKLTEDFLGRRVK